MPSILSDLYNGKCRPFARPYSAAYQKQLSAVCAAQDELIGKLPQDLRCEFIQYCAVSLELSSIGSEEDFIEGFRLGARLMSAALGSDSSAAAESEP